MRKKYRFPNGFGSIYKLSGKRRKPWVYAKTFGWDDRGKQIQKILGYEATEKEAFEKLVKFNNNPLTNVELLDLTFEQAFNKWFQMVEMENKMSKQNQNVYKSVFANHCKSLYKIKIFELKTLDIQHCINTCTCGYNTKKYIKLIASQIFRYCTVQLDMELTKNFSTGLKIGQKEKSEIHVPFTKEEIKILWDNIDMPYMNSILITIYCGLRPTELLTIELENVYLNEHYMIGGIKTNAGINRIIPLHHDIIPLIQQLINNNKKYLIEKDGKKINYRYYYDLYTSILKNLNLEHKPHDGRHTLATELDNINANEVCTKLILGHKIDDITKGVYTHKQKQQLIDTINAIKFC